MYAAPTKAPAATTKTRDATNYSATPAAPQTKLVQYKRDKPAQPATAPSVWGTESRLFPADGQHPLRSAWAFWFMHRAPGEKITDYESAMIRLASFGTVEGFWGVYSHLLRPNQVPTITDYHLFRDSVRPVWEDPANMNGGKWMIRLRKGLATRLWERLAMAVVGDVFDVGDEVCGIVLSIRNSEDILSLWNRTAVDAKTNVHIRDIIKQVLEVPAETIMEYKAHNDSLKDNSSFRNTDVYK